MSQLIVEDLAKSYPTPAEPLVVLEGLSFQLESGQNTAILGPSGSGKSTLLQILGTLDQPTAGSVTLDGVNPFALAPTELAHFRNHNIGFVFQEHHLLPQLTVLENILIPVMAESAIDEAALERAERLIERVGLRDRKTHLPAELSGGERGRVALARALIRQPKVILADEPTGNLDPVTAQTVGELLLELQQEENTMLIVVTHSHELAERMSSRLYLEGRKLVAAPPHPA